MSQQRGSILPGIGLAVLAMLHGWGRGERESRGSDMAPSSTPSTAQPGVVTASDEYRCPAIELDDRRRTHHPGEPSAPVDLVVVGQAQPAGEANLYRLRIERTIYGHSAEGEITCRSFRQLPAGTSQLVALVSNWHAQLVPYEVKYTAPLRELRFHEALARARLDWHASAAQALFVGRDEPEPAADAPDRDWGRRHQIRRVVVRESLGGATVAPGTVVQVELLGVARNSLTKAPRGPWEIYFARALLPAEGGVPERWEVDYRLPGEMARAVQEAYGRRDQFPLRTAQRHGKEIRFREVLFDGTVEQALELLTSDSRPAVELGVRRLLADPAAALPLVTRQVESHLLDQAQTNQEDPHPYRLQARLIETLAQLEERRIDGVAGGAIRRLLSAIAERQAAPPARPAQGAAARPYAANQSLRWLIAALDQEAVARQFGAELLRLAAEDASPWQRELRELVVAERIEQLVEWDAAQRRAADWTPVRSRAALGQEGRYLLVFSPSGHRLATVGGGSCRIWNPRDWSRVGEWEWSGVPEGLQFTPDETQLWIGGERDDEGVLERVDVATGRVTQTLSADRLPIDGLALSRDGRWVAAASDEEQHLHLWDTTTGERRRTWELEDGSSRFLLRPDGQLLLREMRADSWQVEPVENRMAPADGASADSAPRRAPVRTTRLPFRAAVFSPAGDVLYALERAAGEAAGAEEVDNPQADGESWVVSVRRGGGDFAWLPQRSVPVPGNELRLSASGNRLAVHSPRETQSTFTLLDIPSLRLVARCTLPHTAQEGHAESWQLSPDGKVLAVAIEDEAPALFNTDTGERFTPGLGHQSAIVELAFSVNGRTLTTRDEEGAECEWDARNLRMLRRVALPDENRTAPSHPGLDGPFTDDGRSEYRIQTDSRGRQLRVQVTDRATGKQSKAVEAPLPWVPDGPRGLVPGGRYLHCGTIIFDRDQLRLVSAKPLRGMNVQRMAFTADGGRYAVAARRRSAGNDDVEREETVVTLHDTLTGQLLAVLPPFSQPVVQLAFSPDGRRLIVALADHELQGWAIPLPERTAP